MADILIRGMAMPENCIHCRFAVDGWCYAYGKPNIPALEKAEVSNFCPLVPLPEGHGRLIDADYLDVDEVYTTEYGFQRVVWADLVDSVPTIIPASEGGREDG